MSVPTTRPGGADPLAEDPEPAHDSAAQIQNPPARASIELRQQLSPGGLPDTRLQLQPLELRKLPSQ